MPPRSASITPLLGVTFIGALGYSIVIPFLVYLVEDFGGNPLVYGLIGATYPAFQLIGAPLLGRWSDRIGRRKVLLVSQAGTLLAWLMFLVALLVPVTALAELGEPLGPIVITIPLLVLGAARAIDGLTGGNVSVANAYLADITTEVQRKASFGKMAAASNVGFVIGPAVAGLLGATVLGEIVPVATAAVVAVVGLVLIAVLLPESKPKDADLALTKRCQMKKLVGQEHRECQRPSEQTLSFRQVLRRPGVGFLVFLYFAIFLAFNFFYTAFPIHAAGPLGWSVTTMGTYFSVMSLVMVLVQGPLLSWLSKRVSDGALAIAGSALLTLTFPLMSTTSQVLPWIAVISFAVGNGIMWPSYLSILSGAAGDEHQGSVQGVAGAAGSAASIVGLVAGGVVYQHVGGIVFWIAGAVMLGVCALCVRLPRITPPGVDVALDPAR